MKDQQERHFRLKRGIQRRSELFFQDGSLNKGLLPLAIWRKVRLQSPYCQCPF